MAFVIGGGVFLKTLNENSDGKELLECPKQKKIKITREGLHQLAQP